MKAFRGRTSWPDDDPFARTAGDEPPPPNARPADDDGSWPDGPTQLFSHRRAPGGPAPAAQPGPGIATRIGLALADFLAQSSSGVAYVVDGLMAEGGLYAFTGRPESFKTFCATHLGLCLSAGRPDFLGLGLGTARPFVYISNEKSGQTVRERLRTQSTNLPPVQDVQVIHRQGATFGDREGWRRVVDVVAAFERPPFVVADTLASLSGPGFDENSGKDMGVALGALRQLTDVGATAALVHHPSKHGEGTGGIRMRGHTSLWGEVDGVFEFTRPDRAVDGGLIRIEPKDGELLLMPFKWNRDTFLLETDSVGRFLTAQAIAEVVAALYREDTPLRSEEIAAKFPQHGATRFMERLSEAVDLGLITRTGKGKATRYAPGERGRFADDRLFGGADE